MRGPFTQLPLTDCVSCRAGVEALLLVVVGLNFSTLGVAQSGAAVYNIRWLLQMIAEKGLGPFLRLIFMWLIALVRGHGLQGIG